MGEANEDIQTALDILNLANAAIPGILKLINLIQSAEGSMTVAQLREQAGAVFAFNHDQIAEWKRKHPERV